MYKKKFKRIVDLILAIMGLLILSPVFIIVFISLFFANQGEAFFFQKRAGKNDKLFYIIKFKTMNNKKDEKGDLLPDNDRLTKVGIFVRKTSLDEIPQLINILKGEMSLIGPRPLLPEYLSFYNSFQKRRTEAVPGITGWAQVNGRNTISWEEKFNYDVWYVDNLSFALDVKIFFLTIMKIFKSEGINDPNGNIVEPFDKYMTKKNG